MREAFDGAHEYTDKMSRLTGQHIDPYTHVPDHRTALDKFEETCARWDRLQAKIEKRIGRAKPCKALVLKPALPTQEPSRAKQKHQEQI